MIILEGCDGTGKTTLAKKLIKDLGLTYFKKSVPEGDPFQDYLKTIGEAEPTYIFDRLYLGERVYPQVKPNRTPMALTKKQLLERLLNAKGAILLLCHGTNDQILETFLSRGEDFITFDEAKKVNSLYRVEYTQAMVYHKIAINPKELTEQTYQDLLTYLKAKLEKSQELHKRSLKFLNNGYSYHDEKVVLVGDKPSLKTLFDEQHRYAFSGYEGSSLFLAECLGETSNPYRYYITNACKFGGQLTDKDISLLAEELSDFKFPPSRLVAMGTEASTALKKLGIKHEYTFHPQYWKRFKSKHRTEFVDFLNR